MKELIKLQNELRVRKDNAPSNNRYKYRKVDDILRAVKECNMDNIYIVLSDELVCLNNNVYTKGTATIHNGETSVSASSYAKEGQLPGQSDPQISGSCSTYARKKALEGLLALDDGNDPDGNPLPEKTKAPKQIKLASSLQRSVLKDYTVKFKAIQDSVAIEYISEALKNQSMTEIEAAKIISHCKTKLGEAK